MKIGIISELNLNTANYGNNLQAFALNHYLTKRFNPLCVHSIALKPGIPMKATGILSVTFAKKLWYAMLRRIRNYGSHQTSEPPVAVERQQSFCLFRDKNFSNRIVEISCDKLNKTDYDVIVVGSDIVWFQFPHKINRIQFLDFSAQKRFKRIAYAASFGRDYIPQENKRYVCKYLKKFDAISVREHSSVFMLNSMGISEVSYCVDPTLLLSINEWLRIEERPALVDENEKYIFVYLLGPDMQHRIDITNFSQATGLTIVSIPNAVGQRLDADELLSGKKIDDCSIENWLWLIHHAQYVITDSFHGVVFSTIYRRKFIVLKRTSPSGNDMNNRMQDYLREIDQLDKSIESSELYNVEHLKWDYEQIDSALELRRKNSIAFLDRALGDINEKL